MKMEELLSNLSKELTERLSKWAFSDERKRNVSQEEVSHVAKEALSQFQKGLESSEEAKNNFMAIPLERWDDEILDPLFEYSKDQLENSVPINAPKNLQEKVLNHLKSLEAILFEEEKGEG